MAVELSNREQPGHCPPRDFGQYGGLAGQIAAHARGTIRHWQILNEPSFTGSFTGTPEDYGQMLSASHAAIKRTASEDLVLPGNGYPHSGDQDWYGRAFATAGAGRKYDISAINIRGNAEDMALWLKLWRRFLSQQGFKGPIWVVEHGYPADTKYQYDPAFVGGDSAQARYMARSLRALEGAGAAEVFVTPRHRDLNQWTSEGLVDLGDPPVYPALRRPAFYTTRDWGSEWRRCQAGYRERAAWYRDQSRRLNGVAAASDRDANLARGKAKRAKRRERKYLRRAKKLRAAARRHELCFERTAAPACAQGAARARTRARRGTPGAPRSTAARLPRTPFADSRMPA